MEKVEDIVLPIWGGGASDETATASGDLLENGGGRSEGGDGASSSEKIFEIAFGGIEASLLERTKVEMDILVLRNELVIGNGGGMGNLAFLDKMI